MESMSLCFPEKSKAEIYQMAKANYINYGCGLIELLWMPQFSEKTFKKWIVVKGFEKYQKAMGEGKGVFLLTLHMGAWELMTATNQVLKIPIHVITKKFKAKGLNQVWVNMRKAKGIKLIEEEKTTFQILRAIRGGECVGFILDQFMGPPVGVLTTFFGRPTGTPAALALFAGRTQAPVVPVYNYRRSDGSLEIVFEDPIPFMEQGSTEKNISFMTQIYTNKIEDIVRKHPEQWMWLHRRWKPFRP